MTPLRAVFLDIGDTVLRANPSWEGVYTLALEEYGITIPTDDLRDALRRAASSRRPRRAFAGRWRWTSER
jgi:hypothetical protein